MRSRTSDPRRLDVQAFAREAGSLEGTWPVASLERLKSSLFRPDADAGNASWAAQGEMRKPNSLQPQTWLHLTAHASVELECQRCLGAVRTALDVDRFFHFVPSEDEAAELDAEEEDDVLALPRSLDLLDMVDEELLLALPIVPRHERCPEPLPLKAEPEAGFADDESPHPFAALASLKRGPAGRN